MSSIRTSSKNELATRTGEASEWFARLFVFALVTALNLPALAAAPVAPDVARAPNRLLRPERGTASPSLAKPPDLPLVQPLRASSDAMVGNASIPIYDIGSIPPQQVRMGGTLSFQLWTTGLGANFSYTIDPGYFEPRGSIVLDTSSGRFDYTPAIEDRFEFRITLTRTTSGGDAVSQSVAITPIADVPPETDLIQSGASVPDPASVDYLLITERPAGGQEMFNGALRPTMSAEITGKAVVFDASTLNYGGLYARFHNRLDLKSLTIYAETLVIRSAIHLPGTDVTVFARHLRFEDASTPASLDTTPLPYLLAAAQFQDGLSGQKGGDVRLFVSDWFAKGSEARIISGGGVGQNPGQGRPGNPKPAMWNEPISNFGGRAALEYPFRKQGWGWIYGVSGTTSARVVYITHSAVWCQFRIDGSQTWPADGENGIPAGVPGTGGSGGTVSALDPQMLSYARMPGGKSGQQGLPQPGGPPQEPQHALWVRSIDGSRCTDDYFNFEVIGEHFGKPGTDAAPPTARQSQGVDGMSNVLGDPATNWLHPNFLRMVIAHAKDAYRLGNLAYTQGILDDYSSLLDQLPTFPEAFALDFQQAQDDIQRLRFRLANNMDYFGNTAGWAPLLSLEATMNAFGGEVENAVPILFLSQWLNAKGNQHQRAISVLQDGMQKLSVEADRAAVSVNTASQEVPALRFEADKLSSDLEMIATDLQRREEQLLQEAERNVADRHKVEPWKKALRVIGTIAQTVPAYQPALGAIGKGLDFVATVDVSKPLDLIKGAPDAPVKDIALLFKGKTWTESATSFDQATQKVDEFVGSIDFRNFNNAKESAHKLEGVYKDLSGYVKATIQQLQGSQISDAEIKVEFDRIRAQDDRMNDLIERTAELQTRKQLFVQRLAHTMEDISAGTATMGQDLVTIASMQQNLNATVGELDHALVLYVRNMEQRARERLLKYQYFMAKAYEYRMLKPYPGDLNIDSVVNKIMDVMSTTYPASTTAIDAVKSMYVESVRQIVSEALTELQKAPPERSVPLFFSLTDLELQQLNETGRVTLDLRSRIAGLPNEDNRHIANLRIEDVKFQPTGSLGSFARIRFVAEHSGESTETLNGRRYRFHFGNSPTDQLFLWGASYTLPNGPLSQETHSFAGLSLLQSFLKMPGPVDPTLALFARPGADAIITLSRFMNPSSLTGRITSLQMSADVDFYRGTSRQTRLSVNSSAGSPYITLDQADVTGRKDGVGNFERTFPAGQPVTLLAEATYQSMQFVKWTDASAQTLSTSTTLSLSMSTNQDVRVVYMLLPGAPNSPNPMSDAGNVGTMPKLTWVSSNATSYDVKFGTSNSLPTVSSGQTDASYTTPVLTNGTTYFWQIVARNTIGSTPGPIWKFKTQLAAGTLSSDDFEHGRGDWTSTGTWALTTEFAHSDTYAWSDSPGGDYGPNLNVSLMSPTFDLRSATAPQLRFWHRRNFAADGYDQGNVWVTTDGGWTYTFMKSFTGSELTWKESTIDLTPYVGLESVRVYFQVLSNESQSGDGWYIDDVVVKEALAPTVTTGVATGSGMTAATLIGTVNPNGTPTTARFEYGLTTTYELTTPVAHLGNGTDAVPIDRGEITGLSCGRSYHFRAVATSAAGTTNGDDASFVTAACMPSATTGIATGITATAATLGGVVNPNGASGVAYFEYGETAAYNGTSTIVNVGSGTSAIEVSGALSGLACGTLYHFRVVVNNTSGLTPGADATFSTGECVAKAELTTPAPGSTLNASTATFQWTEGKGVSQYGLDIGTAKGGMDLFNQTRGTTVSAVVTGLPTNGSTVYVRLWSLVGGTWDYDDYTYTATSVVATRAELTTPAPRSTLAASTVTFEWTGGTGVSQYGLEIGTTPGGVDLFTQKGGTALSATVSDLPTNGRPLYVRLGSSINGTWEYNDYVYTASLVNAARAELTTPAPGTTLTASTVAFQWTGGARVSEYWLDIGTTVGGLDLFSEDRGTSLSATVAGLPSNGRPLYVRLWSLIAGSWEYNDYTYTASTVKAAPAELTVPAPASTLTASSVTFQWTGGTGVSEYWLEVGTTPGVANLFDHDCGASLSATVADLPADGSTVYVRLWSLIDGSWDYREYTYTASTARAAKAEMTVPAPGSTLTASTVAFQWTGGTGATKYWLEIGRSAGSTDLFDQDRGTDLNATVKGLPTNGSTIYVRLWSLVDGSWEYNEYTYTASTVTTAPAELTTPAPGSTLTTSTAVFQWTGGTGVSQYRLTIGTAVGGAGIFDQNRGTNLSATVKGLPANGSAVYVRLWSLISGSWQYNDYTYTASSLKPARAELTTPAPGSTLTASTMVFQWTGGTGVSQYRLSIGTTAGGVDLFDQDRATNLSATVKGLPTDGSTVYVRLWSLIGGSWQYNDYIYRAVSKAQVSTAASLIQAIGWSSNRSLRSVGHGRAA